MDKLRTQLSFELQSFEQRLRAKDPNDEIQVEAKKGYEMAIDSQLLLLLILLVLFKPLITSRRNQIQ